MYDINQRQYIISLSSGKVMNFFHKENNGICYSVFSKRGNWLEPSLILRDALPNFSLCLDQSENIHILYQDRQGNIMHLTNTANVWKTKSILNSKNPSSYEKYLKVAVLGETTYFIYILEHDGSRLLSYQYQDKSGSISKPKVIDYVVVSKTPYQFVIDGVKGISIFYNSADIRHPGIGYRTFSPTSDKWSEFYQLSNESSSLEFLSALSDKNSSLHACWQNFSAPTYELVYCNQKSDVDQCNHKVLASSSSPFNNLSLVIVGDIVIAYWIKDSRIYYCFSQDNGETWSSQDKYLFDNDKTLYCFTYITKNQPQSGDINYSELPGTFTGGYKLAFINDDNFKVDNHKSNIPELLVKATLDGIAADINQLKLISDELKEFILEFETRLNKLETSCEKLESKSSVINDEFTELKSKLEELNKPQALQQPELIHPDLPEKPETNNDTPNSTDIQHNVFSANLNKNGLNHQVPIMPGAGFAHITPEFLKSKKK